MTRPCTLWGWGLASAFVLSLTACETPPTTGAAYVGTGAARPNSLLAQAELALQAGRFDTAERLLEQAQALDPQQARAAQLAAALARQRAAAQVAAPLPTSPGVPPGAPLPSARETSAAPASRQTLGPGFQRPVSLEFRDAALRQVFEALARSSNVNFVFDKDVRADARITVFLRSVTLDEAMRTILATQQLDRKLLNDNTVLIYPNTAPKQREHQELVTRSLYLANADPRQALTLVRTMAKTRDIHVDERLNAIVVRDTPEVVRQIEQLLATIDLPEPEVMLAVEVLEVASDKLDELGLQWPTGVAFGLPGVEGSVLVNGTGFRGTVANPVVTATLRGTSGHTRLLANPSIRARSREKAKVQIGEKLPVFTTAAVANAGVSATVSYLDVGLKLEVEPTVQLDGEVLIKLSLEVSNLLREVRGPAGSQSLAYQIGTRSSSTALRLKDGQTQVLAGLINDEDRRSANGLPGLSRLPIVGRLFGVQGDTRVKTEIVMLITPHIVRAMPQPSVQQATLASGTESLPGALPLRLRPAARVGVGAGSGGGSGGASGAAGAPAPAAEPAAAPAPTAGLQIGATGNVLRPGDTAAVTLVNRGAERARGELLFDATLAQAASAAAGASTPGRWPFDLNPGAEAVLVLRLLPTAAGQGVAVGVSADVPVQGEALLRVAAPEAPR